MQFQCITCSDIYLELEDLEGEVSRTVVGICPSCSRLRIGEDACELATERATATVDRESPNHLKLISRTPEK